MVSRSSRSVVAVALVASLALVGCSTAGTAPVSGDSAVSATQTTPAGQSGATVSLTDNHGAVEVPANPATIVSLDNRSFEILEQWGVKLAAAPQDLIPATIGYKTDTSIVNIGNHREPNLEAIVAAKPDVIITGQRFLKFYEDLKKLNPDTPIIDFEPREGEAFDAELKRHTEAMGKVFGKEAEAAKLIADFDAAIARAKAAYKAENTVMAVNVSGGEIGYIAPSVGRTFGPIFDLLGLTPALKVEGSSSNHEGDDISVEAIAESNPQFILILDRDAAVAAQEAGYTPAQDVIAKSEALKNVNAVKEGKLVLAPADTYTNENIITFTEIINSIAEAFEAAK